MPSPWGRGLALCLEVGLVSVKMCRGHDTLEDTATIGDSMA